LTELETLKASLVMLGETRKLKGTHETIVLKGLRLKVPDASAVATQQRKKASH
jgi:hypothetical protein